MEQAAALPWIDHFQSSRIEAEAFQPLLLKVKGEGMRERYRRERDLFAHAELSRIPFTPPSSKTHQLLNVLKAWNGSPLGVPLNFYQCPSGAAPICVGQFPSLAEGCQLALLWALYSQKHSDKKVGLAAEKLAGWLLAQIRARLFTLGSTDSDYDEKESLLSAALLLRACELETEANALYRSDLPKNLFFRYLYDANPRICFQESSKNEPLLGYQWIDSGSDRFVLSLSGKKSPAGAGSVGGAEIRAFGLQGKNLADLSTFGVDSTFSDRGWFRSAASREAWFQILARGEQRGFSFSLQQVGSQPDTPVALSFYVAVESCEIGGKILKAKSLQKFSGLSNRVGIGNGPSLVFDRPLKIEVIPLAGEGAFWGASFLIAVWLPPFDCTLSCQIVP